MEKDTEDPEELYQQAMESMGNDEDKVYREGFLDSEAFQYLLRAGELGHSESQLLLGMAYSYAYAHDLDDESLSDRANGWYDKAVENGNLRALLIRARSENSKELFRKVVDSDPTDPKVQSEIGHYYDSGYVVDEDPAAAAEWYSKAAEQGDGLSIYKLSVMYRDGRGVEQSYDMAFQYSLRSAELGNALSQWHTGLFYEEGIAVEQSYERSAEWFKKAAENGEPLAMASLGNSYENGWGVIQSYAKAAELYSQAMENDEPLGMIGLGRLYENGWGVEQSYRKAYRLYTKAVNDPGYGRMMVDRIRHLSECRSHIASLVLGDCYAKGQHIDGSDRRAYELYTEALYDPALPDERIIDMIDLLKDGNRVSIVVIGDCHERGFYVERSHEKALELYTRAAAMDCDIAIAKLSFMKKGTIAERDDPL